MLDVAVHNEAENWFFNKRFAALPRVGEQVQIDAGVGKTEYTVVKVWHEESAEEREFWTPHVDVAR